MQQLYRGVAIYVKKSVFRSASQIHIRSIVGDIVWVEIMVENNQKNGIWRDVRKSQQLTQ